MSKGESKEYRTRLKEITSVLHKYGITRGITPQKLRMILEDLGPTYIKIGQIMSLHSDILPKRYCDELMRLRSEVTPMEFPEVKEVIEQAYGCPWNEIFASISDTPLGSASIAQVHRAELLSGEQVVIKVQRTGIYEIMARDIGLLRKAVKLMPPISLKGMADFDQVLDELWNVTREEMNFLTEASNMEEFARRNEDVVYVRTPKLYQEYTTMHVLVMEYIEGPAIDDKEKLLSGGYDLEEIGIKLIDNYIKQVMEDGFFHADPHPGNVKVQDGKIVWIDMGMMGRLTERDKELIGKAIRGIAENDIGMIQEAVMALGEFKEKPDQSVLYEDISELMSKYGSLDMGEIDVAEVMMDLMEVMKENKIRMPHGLTMLARGLTNMEGVLADIAPQINMIEIASRHIAESMWKDLDWKKELKHAGKNLYRSMHKAVEVPGLAADALHGLMKGQTRVNLDLHASNDLAQLLRRLVRNVVMGLWVMALLISSSIICTTNMSPKICGIPAIGAIGYLFAFAIVMYVLIKHIFSK
ncbi:ABC1 kinase family protein [Dorea sp.]